MKFSQRDLTLAISQLATCRFFPADEGARAAIAILLARICPHKEALEWLVGQFINRINDWRGPGELRGVLCTRYRPADGIEANCSVTPGYRPEDGEARTFGEHQQRKVGWAEVYRKLIEGMNRDCPQ